MTHLMGQRIVPMRSIADGQPFPWLGDDETEAGSDRRGTAWCARGPRRPRPPPTGGSGRSAPRQATTPLIDAVLLDRPHGVRRAGRVVAAHVTVRRRDHGAVAAQNRDAPRCAEAAAEDSRADASNRASPSDEVGSVEALMPTPARDCAQLRPAALERHESRPGSARMTMSDPGRTSSSIAGADGFETSAHCVAHDSAPDLAAHDETESHGGWIIRCARHT